METKHTPGPWKLNTDGDTGMNDSGCILDSIGHVIVTEIYGTFKNGRTTGEAEANARLIAAATDLLAALRAIVARINGVWDDPDLLAFGELLPDTEADIEAIASQAIAKARGGK